LQELFIDIFVLLRYTLQVELLTAKGLSDYLKINEKKIYQLARESDLPHIWIGGKILFPRERIDRWISEKLEREKHCTLAGSDDILLKRIIDQFNKSGESIVFYASLGSIKGLRALEERAAAMSAVHLLDVETGSYGVACIQRYLGEGTYKVIHLYQREQGFLVKRGNPKEIRALEDLLRPGVTSVNRNEGSGTRLLFDYLLARGGIVSDDVRGYRKEAQSHLEAGLMVMQGEADCAFGIEAVAAMMGLDFIPLHREPFELVVPGDGFESEGMRRFVSFLDQAVLIRYVREYRGYDITDMGRTRLLSSAQSSGQ